MADKAKPNLNLLKFQEAAKRAGQKTGNLGNARGASAGAKRKAAAPTKAAPATRSVKLGTVYLAVPDKRAVMMLSNQIKTLKLDTASVATGQELIDKVKEEVPKLIILAKDLEDMSGLTCCSRVRALPGASELPIIIAAPDKSEQTLNGAIMAGATDIIGRPFSMPDLMAKIKQYARFGAKS